ncbi:MAG: Na/Pi cotransporter family protein, partial [Clostridia bacterium]
MTLTDVIFSLLTMCGGAALFLYGMKVMSGGLEKVAGDSMQKLIENLTSNIFKAVLVGAAVTALIQASGATTVMVVGFVNAGIMTLRQAAGVIMGANIGTTVTAQILSLAGVSGDVWYLRLLKPSMLANFLLLAGIILVMFMGKKNRNRVYVGEIMIGLGAVFIGMGIMTDSVSAMKDLPVMKTIFTGISNPVLGILAGAAITALLQSSSASVGILQAFTVTGLITWSNAIPMILGQNIGTCMVALISGMGANKNAKRASILHLLFNIIGVVLCFVLVYGLDLIFHFSFWDDKLTMHSVANFHLAFNVINTIILLPCRGLLVKLACIIIPDVDKHPEKRKGGSTLDERFMLAPAIAVRQAMNEVVTMAETALKGYDMAIRVVQDDETELIDSVKEIENDIDRMESGISQYVTKIVA